MLLMACNIPDGTGRYCFDMFGGENIEGGTGRDGRCEFSRRDGTVQYKDLFVSGRDGTVNENWHDGTGP